MYVPQLLNGLAVYNMLAGKYEDAAVGDVALRCAACPADSYSATGAGACATCADGSKVKVDQTGCAACEPGQAGTGGTCGPCGADEYTSGSGNDACIACGDGRVVNGAKTTCTACPAAWKEDAATHECVACGADRYSTGGKALATVHQPYTGRGAGVPASFPDGHYGSMLRDSSTYRMAPDQQRQVTSDDWAYTTIVVEVAEPFGSSINFETDAVGWFTLDEVDGLRCHAGVVAAWPRLREIVESPATP